MTYQRGDYVYPADMRRVFCRVAAAASICDGTAQFLELEPLEGPWPPGTRLIRLDEAVRRAVHAKNSPSATDTLHRIRPA